MGDFRDCSQTPDFDTSLSFGTMRKTTTALLKDIHEELDKLAATGTILSEVLTIDLDRKISNCHVLFLFGFFFDRTSASVKVCRYA